MRTVLVLSGIPASGKSSFARDLTKKEPDKYKHINNDSLREAFDFSVFSKENEKFIRKMRGILIKEALKNGFDVILDNLNLGDHFKETEKLCKSLNMDVQIIEKLFPIDLEEAILRDSKREGVAKVGEDVIKQWWKKSGGKQFQFRKPRHVVITANSKKDEEFTGLIQDESKSKAIICDLDGCLALIGDRSPYSAEDCDIKDTPNKPVVETVKTFYEKDYHIIFCSGREDKYEPETRRFINKHVRVSNPNFTLDVMEMDSTKPITYDLFMRKTNDFRKDSIIKSEIFDENINGKFYIEFVLDDRTQVVEMWREKGLTCFQVAPGDF